MLGVQGYLAPQLHGRISSQSLPQQMPHYRKSTLPSVLNIPIQACAILLRETLNPKVIIRGL